VIPTPKRAGLADSGRVVGNPEVIRLANAIERCVGINTGMHIRNLTDEQWKTLDPLIPKPRRRRDGRGRPWKSRRSVLNGVLWVLRTGAPSLGDQSHRTAKAIAWIRANYAKPLRVEDVAEIAGMGVSTLHHHFRALTAMSPLQYQKQLRLQAARGLMLLNGLDAASAAFEVGYESTSQFNREYSRFFGQPPMRELRTLRAPGALPVESVSSRQSIV
jgi:AraC-like DNA-binding protein